MEWFWNIQVRTTEFLYPKHHPEDDRSTGRNMLVKKVYIPTRHIIKAHALVTVYIL